MRFTEFEGNDRCNNACRKGVYDEIVLAFVKSGLDIAKIEFDEEDVEHYDGQLKTWWDAEGVEAKKKTLSNIASTINARIKGNLWINEIIDAMIQSGIKMRCKSNGEWPVMPHACRCGDSIAFEYVRPTKEMLARYRKEKTENAD